MRFSCFSLAVGLLAGCGARASLPEPTGHAASGGSTSSTSTSSTSTSSTSTSSTSTSSTSSTTGTGGGPVSGCATLVSAGAPAVVPNPDGWHDAHHPWFADVPGLPLVVLTQRSQLESPIPAPDALSAVRVKPWESWPPAFDAPGDVAGGIAWGTAFVAGAAPDTSSLSLLFTRVPQGAGSCDVALMLGVDPLGLPNPGSILAPFQAGCDSAPVFVASGPSGLHAVATDDAFPGGGRELHTRVVTAAGDSHIPIFDCASTPQVADALGHGDGFSVVLATGQGPQPFSGACYHTLTPARQLVRVSMGDKAPAAHDLAVGADDFVFLRLLPRPSGGAWLVTRESGASAEVQPPATAAPYDLDGALGPAHAITDPGAGLVAAAPAGQGLASAFTSDLPDGSSRLTVRLHDADLAVAEGTLELPAYLFPDRLAVVASPQRDAVLVAWTEVGPGYGGRAVLVARFDCRP